MITKLNINLFTSNANPPTITHSDTYIMIQPKKSISTKFMKEACLYSRPDPTSTDVQCKLCPHSCHIRNGHTGICHTRKNIEGTLYAINYGKLVAARPDPVEKKPLYHFYPEHLSYSISSVGCNLRCHNCQNSSISQQNINNIHIKDTSPQDVVKSALHHDCKSIAYTYTEPTTLLEFVLDTAKRASPHNIQNIMVSNGFMSDQCIDLLIPAIQAINIDLKSFSESFYKKICHARLAPVLNTIRRLHQAGIHVEITTLIIPDLNDNDNDLNQICEFICSVHPEIPWHISRFHPSYKLSHTPVTPIDSLIKAKIIGENKGLQHIYIGNAPEIESHTYCHHCKTILFERSGFSTTSKHFIGSHCSQCKTKLFGKFT